MNRSVSLNPFIDKSNIQEPSFFAKFSPVLAIPNAEIYRFGSNEKITESTWPSVWFTKVKQKFLDDMREQEGNAVLRLALCDCLNELGEVL